MSGDDAVSFVFMQLPAAPRIKIISFLCPFMSIPRQLDDLLRRWDLKSPPGEPASEWHSSAVSQPLLDFIPPAVVVDDVRTLSEALTSVLVLTCSEIELGHFLTERKSSASASGGTRNEALDGLDETAFEAIRAAGSQANLADCNWQRLGGSPGGAAINPGESALLAGILARDFVHQNQQRVGNYFQNLPGLCMQVTKLSFKLQKHDIYVAERGDQKLREHCPQLLRLISAAQKVSSAYRHRAMSGVGDMCRALCAGLQAASEEMDPPVP